MSTSGDLTRSISRQVCRPATTVGEARSKIRLAAWLAVWTVLSAAAFAAQYPLDPSSLCGATRTCQAVLDAWNDSLWADVVDESFHIGLGTLAAVRWYSTEFPCTPMGTLCEDQLQNCGTQPFDPDVVEHRFCGVTDELSNVLLAVAMGSQESRFRKLRNFVELLRDPAINGLQCWKYRIGGAGDYGTPGATCVEHDSASDASLRILHAYAIACARQQAGDWTPSGADYCGDYLTQGNAIWGLGTGSHGEIRLLPNGEYFLANGYNNQVGAPTAPDSFRPDYYELQPLMDFAEHLDRNDLREGVLDMLADVPVSMGDNSVSCGKTGHFDLETSSYGCDQNCFPPYLDQIDTWRAVPALSNLALVHSERIPAVSRVEIFDAWWANYSGGHPTLYGPSDPKPIEIWCRSTNGGVKATDSGYKTLCMWMPLSAAYDSSWAVAAVSDLVDNQYDWSASGQHFWGADYFGAYFSAFSQRALGAVTGLIDPRHWTGEVFDDGFESGGTSEWGP